MLVSVLLKIKFGHAQICVPKIGIPMLKIACVNLWSKVLFSYNQFLILSPKKNAEQTTIFGH